MAQAPDFTPPGFRRRSLAVDDEAVQDVYAQREDRQRPPRVRSPDRQQRLERANRGGNDSDHPAVATAAHERQPRSDLDDAHDDRDPPPGVKAREHELRVVEEISVPDCGNTRK